MIACKPLTLSGTAEVPLLPRADSAVHQDEHTHTSQSLEESCVFYSQALLVIEMSAHVSRTWLKITPLSHTQTLLVIKMSAHVSRTWLNKNSSFPHADPAGHRDERTCLSHLVRQELLFHGCNRGRGCKLVGWTQGQGRCECTLVV